MCYFLSQTGCDRNLCNYNDYMHIAVSVCASVVEQKRQGAQLKRLQRLVSEAHAQRRQWVQEEEKLRTDIRHIKDKMEG